MEKILNRQFIFIIGAPRSGTTWLQIMLGSHPMVCTTVELALYHQYVTPWLRGWEREASDMERGRWCKGLPFLWDETDFYDFLKEFLARTYEAVIAPKPKASHILDKEPSNALYVQDIHKLLPEARFIHLIRDGRDVAISMVAARKQIGFGTGTISKSADVWKTHILAARKAAQYRGQYLEVRYEDLLAKGSSILKEVFDFCGLQASMAETAAIVNAHQFEKMKTARLTPAENVPAPEGHYRIGKAGNWRKELPPLQRYLFDRVAGDLLRELGYAEEGWWAESTVERWLLPLWAALFTQYKTHLPKIRGGHIFPRLVRLG